MTEDTSVWDQSDKLIMKITSRISINFDLKYRGFGFSAYRVPMILQFIKILEKLLLQGFEYIVYNHNDITRRSLDISSPLVNLVTIISEELIALI